MVLVLPYLTHPSHLGLEAGDTSHLMVSPIPLEIMMISVGIILFEGMFKLGFVSSHYFHFHVFYMYEQSVESPCLSLKFSSIFFFVIH